MSATWKALLAGIQEFVENVPTEGSWVRPIGFCKALAAEVERIEADSDTWTVSEALKRAEAAEADAKGWEACIKKWAETVKAWDAKVYAAEAALATAHASSCTCDLLRTGLADPRCTALRALVYR